MVDSIICDRLIIRLTIPYPYTDHHEELLRFVIERSKKIDDAQDGLALRSGVIDPGCIDIAHERKSSR